MFAAAAAVVSFGQYRRDLLGAVVVVLSFGIEIKIAFLLFQIDLTVKKLCARRPTTVKRIQHN